MPLDPDPKSVPVLLPDWGAFRVAMLMNKAYQHVSVASTDQRAVSRIETAFSTEAENWPIVALFWQQMITGCAIEAKPKPQEAAAWSAIAKQTNMPFSFSDSGDLKLNQ